MIDAVIAKLKLATLDGKPLFNKVEEALSLGLVMKTKLTKSPVAYVIEISRRPSSNERDMGPVCQRIITTLGVVIGISSRNDLTGSKAKSIVDPILKQTRQTLFGFIATTEHSPFLLGNADTVGTTDSVLWKLERFTTEHYEEPVNE